MGANVEIKARVADPVAVERVARELTGGAEPVVLQQEDTFFPCASGRLKLRKLAPDRGELIHYHRADRAGPKTSRYTLVPTTTPHLLRDTLAAALGTVVVVKKTRRLWLVGPTRVHLDAVEGLGDFLELEVVLAPGQAPSEGEAIARDLMAKLGVAAADLVEGAYADLLASESSRRPSRG
jgi:adenylate cyclase class IV